MTTIHRLLLTIGIPGPTYRYSTLPSLRPGVPRRSVSRGANPGTDSQFPANCAGNSVSVPGLRLGARVPRQAVIADDGARLRRRIRAKERPRSGDPRVALDHAFVHRHPEARGARHNQVAALNLQRLRQD